MTTGPFIVICLVVFGGLAIVSLPELFEGPTFNRCAAAFFLIMAVWAAGLLLQPSTS